MASLGKLVVSLSAEISSFTSALDRASQTAASRMAAIEKSAKVAGAAIGIALAAGAGMAVVLVKNAIDSADAMDDLAQKTGLSMETLAGLAHVANIEGKSLETLTMSMSKLAGATADAAAGQGEAAKVFDALGIKATDANGKLKNSDVVLGELATKFSGMEDGAAKTALAMGVFGKSGADMIPILNMGAEGLAEATAQARAFGLVLDSETAAAAANFNDNLTRLNAVKAGFANQIMKAVVPSLTNMTDRLVDAATKTDGMDKAARVAATGMKLLFTGGSLIVGVFKTIGEYLGGVAAQAVAFFSGRFREAMDIGSQANADFVGNLRGIAGTISDIWDEAGKVGESKAPEQGKKIAAPVLAAAEAAKKGRKDIKTEAEKAAEDIQRMLASIAQEADTMNMGQREVTAYKLAIAGATEEQMRMANSIYDVIDSKKAEIDVQERAKKVMESVRTPNEAYQEQLIQLNALVNQGAISWEIYERAVKKAQGELEEANNKGKDGISDLQKAVEGWGDKFTDTFVDGVMKGKLSFRDLANSIIADILRISIKKQVLNALGDFGGSGGSGGAGLLGSLGSVVSGIAGLFGGGSGLAFADGGAFTNGIVSKPTAFSVGVMGEAGPEAIMPLARASDGSLGVRTSGGAGTGKVVNLNYAPVINVAGREDRAAMMADMSRLMQANNAKLMDGLERESI